MWSVVEFSDGIQLVPINWVDKNSGMCKWPPFTNPVKINKAIKDLAMPEDTWNSHKIIRVFVNADTYEVGMKKLRRAEETSDMDTENEEYNKKTRKERARKLFADDDDDDEVELEPLKPKSDFLLTKQIPLPKLSMTTSPCTSNTSTSSFLLDKSLSPSLSLASNTPTATPCTGPPKQTSTPGSSAKISAGVNSTPTKVRNSSIARKLSPFKKHLESDFRRDIFKKLNLLLYEVRKIDERVANVERMLNMNQNKDQLTENCFEDILPLKTIEELNVLEESLKNDRDRFLNMVATLKLLGGCDSHQTIYNIMKRVFSNALADMYSFLGAKKKLSFKSLNLNRVILASARARHPELSEVDYTEAVSKWLVQAKLRLTRELNKEEKEKQKRGEEAE